MALPVLSRAYHVRRDCLLPDRSSITNICKSNVWSLKAHLMNQIATGSIGPTARAGTSVWTCLGSSDGVAGGLDAVDRWGSTFDATKIVFADHSTNHSWFALQNNTLGVQIVIDCQSTQQNILISLCPNVQPLSGGLGGTVSQRPYVLAAETNFGYTSTATNNWISTFTADTTLAVNQRSQFICAADGSFLYFMTRDGLGCGSTAFGVQNPQNSVYFPKRGSDLNAWCFFGTQYGATSGAGAFEYANWVQAGNTAQRVYSGAIATSGGLSRFSFGNTNFDNSGAPVDPLTLDYPALPIAVQTILPQCLSRGVIPDFYLHANRTLILPGTVNDPGGTVSHMALGDLWIPWDGPAATL
jgi:hypothetical protein